MVCNGSSDWPHPAQACLGFDGVQELHCQIMADQEDDTESQSAKKRKRSGPRSRTSSYLGVTRYKRTGRWEAHIWDSSDPGAKKGRQLHLGSFPAAEPAAIAYDRAAMKMRGNRAQLNFPDTDYSTDSFMKRFAHLEKMPFIMKLRAWAQAVEREPDLGGVQGQAEQEGGVAPEDLTEQHDAEPLLPTRRSSRITQRAHTSEPLQGVPTHLPAGAYMASQALVLPPMSLPSASAAHAWDPQGRVYEGRSASYDRSQPDGDDGDSTPLGHRSRSPFLSGPGEAMPRRLLGMQPAGWASPQLHPYAHDTVMEDPEHHAWTMLGSTAQGNIYSRLAAPRRFFSDSPEHAQEEALSAAQDAMHSIFDASSVSARLRAAREGKLSAAQDARPHSAAEQVAGGESAQAMRLSLSRRRVHSEPLMEYSMYRESAVTPRNGDHSRARIAFGSGMSPEAPFAERYALLPPDQATHQALSPPLRRREANISQGQPRQTPWRPYSLLPSAEATDELPLDPFQPVRRRTGRPVQSQEGLQQEARLAAEGYHGREGHRQGRQDYAPERTEDDVLISRGSSHLLSAGALLASMAQEHGHPSKPMSSQ
ncbi:hypothetical protein CVIRNUC_003186 [Coccomyxa viridis]|uniref:AP2/ERF domain-containing protein n=1 Tax=Coccomyxa viridis TaxID=1274662 RepID=A0AAV1HZI3_9CHLO|nr:hypothetical protein CVIRNUC_003186 [Coccomyxa viridis]